MTASVSTAATFDLATGAGSSIADEPSPLLAPAAAVPGDLYRWSTRCRAAVDDADGVLAYVLSTVQMTEPSRRRCGRRAMSRSVLLADVHSSNERDASTFARYDRRRCGADDGVATGTTGWGPASTGSMVVVDGSVLLTAKDLVPSPGSAGPSLVRMAELTRP